MSTVLERARAVLSDLRLSGQLPWDNAGALADMLYTRWYHVVSDAARVYPDQAAYRSAYGSGAAFEPGWRVAALRSDAGPGAIIAERPGEQRLVHATEYVPAAPARLHVIPGDDVLLSARIDELSGGFWHLWSPAWRKAAPKRLVRVYFQVASGHEIAFVRHVAAEAPPAATWNLKILVGAHLAGRVDPAVLYVDRDEGIHAEWVARLIASVAPLLGDGAPPLTARVITGVAWAEDPGGGVSFGEHRCRLLASAACEQPTALGSARSWRRAAAQSFAREGLDLARPHLHGRRRARRAHGV